MGEKSRPGWVVGLCIRDCLNRDKKCKVCLRFSEFRRRTFDNMIEDDQPEWYKKIKKEGRMPKCPDCKGTLVKKTVYYSSQGAVIEQEIPHYNCPKCKQDYPAEDVEE